MAKFWNKLITKRDDKFKFDNYSICIIQTKNENSIENLKKNAKITLENQILTIKSWPDKRNSNQ